MNTMKLTTLEERRLVRDATKDADRKTVVRLIPGDSPPRVRGVYGGWQTKGGREIRYPSAYSKVGWSNMTYVCSTRRVEVGVDWLAEKCPEFRARLLAHSLEGKGG
jgi:hypothetical protein